MPFPAESGAVVDRDGFALLCSALSVAAERRLNLGQTLSDEAIMDAVIELAAAEGVRATLHLAVEKHFRNDVAKARRIVLATYFEANRRRNTQIREVLLALGAAAAASGFSFAVLKGATWALEDASGAAWREMIDIDLLVDTGRYDGIPQFLESRGARRAASSARFRNNFHQFPYLYPGSPATIEVHRHLGWRHRLLPPEVMFAGAQRAAPGLLLPAPWCRALHTIIHWQVQDHGLSRRTIELKDLVDVAHFLERPDVDWRAFVAHARAAGVYEACEAAVALASTLLGAPVPREIAIGAGGARHVELALSQRDSPARTWLATQLWRTGTLWRCEKVSYRLGIKGMQRTPIMIAVWASRVVRLPLLAARIIGIAIRWVAIFPLGLAAQKERPSD